jgi:hypothetical protein
MVGKHLSFQFEDDDSLEEIRGSWLDTIWEAANGGSSPRFLTALPSTSNSRYNNPSGTMDGLTCRNI